MKLSIFHSVPEALLYSLLILLLALDVVGLVITTQDTQKIKHQDACLVSLFFQPNRQQLTLADIRGC